MLYIDLEPEMSVEKIINIRQRTVDIVNIGSLLQDLETGNLIQLTQQGKNCLIIPTSPLPHNQQDTDRLVEYQERITRNWLEGHFSFIIVD